MLCRCGSALLTNVIAIENRQVLERFFVLWIETDEVPPPTKIALYSV